MDSKFVKYWLALCSFVISDAVASFPPTTAKDSLDVDPVTTFNFEFPHFAGSHDGITYTLGVLGISGGGTGQSTANGALNAFLPSQTGNAGRYLLTDGTDTSWSLIANASLASMPDKTFKGNDAGVTGPPLDLTATQATAMLNTFTGDSGAGGVKGLVPAPTTLQGSTYKYLDASGTFTSPGIRFTPAEGVTAVSTWTGRTAAAANQWIGMTWAPELGIFCGISSSGTNRVQWSRDGISWTSASATSARLWTKLAWSPALRMFAAVAFDGTTTTNVMTSPDCVTWTARTSPEASAWYDITWSPALNRFLAVANTGTNRCMYSDNGTIWTACTIPAAQWYSVTWSPELNLFAAVSITANGGNYAATSPDGLTWTMRALTTGNTWYSVKWANEIGLFVAVGATGTNRAATSPDGITWTLRGIQASAWRRVVWSPELRMLVAVASGGQISTSPNGINWTARTSPEANQWYDAVWSPELSRFVISGITGTSRILTSRDLGYKIESKLANDATPLNTAHKIMRRDQNGSFTSNVANLTGALLNSATTATNAPLVIANGHTKYSQTTAPVPTVNANAGTGATCTVTGSTDTAGTVQLVTGSGSWASGEQCSVAFNLAFNAAPKCQLTPINAASATLLNVYLTKTTATLGLNFLIPDTAATTYEWDYFCVETN